MDIQVTTLGHGQESLRICNPNREAYKLMLTALAALANKHDRGGDPSAPVGEGSPHK